MFYLTNIIFIETFQKPHIFFKIMFCNPFSQTQLRCTQDENKYPLSTLAPFQSTFPHLQSVQTFEADLCITWSKWVNKCNGEYVFWSILRISYQFYPHYSHMIFSSLPQTVNLLLLWLLFDCGPHLSALRAAHRDKKQKIIRWHIWSVRVLCCVLQNKYQHTILF